ncbi:hypothetical protein JX266_007196 [Neoarthrinium moseri]|nr:hypothetical protein JX266_007196 [Neoarthrinium moseri]
MILTTLLLSFGIVLYPQVVLGLPAGDIMDYTFTDLRARSDGHCSPHNVYTKAGEWHYDCPRKNTVNENGDCVNAIPDRPDGDKKPCSAYCEVRTSFAYGQEQPFHIACQDCTLHQGEQLQKTSSWAFEIGGGGSLPIKELEATFNFGATYSFSSSITYTTDTEYTPPENYTGCGQWTYVPFTFESCGTLTTAQQKTAGDPFCNQANCASQNKVCEKDKLTTSENFCQSTPITVDGKSIGKVIYVKTDCDSGQALQDGQDEAYYFPGVSTDEKFKSVWPAPPTTEHHSQ